MHTRLITTALVLIAVLCAIPLAAEPRPSSDLLVPYFEVDLGAPAGKTTLFAVGNASDEPVSLEAAVATNWGIQMFTTPIDLAAGEVRTVNLRDWLQRGELPDRTLDPDTLAHVQAALSGQVSPKDNMYYGTQPDPFKTDLAVGYVTLRVTTRQRPDVLWGDYFYVTPGEDFAEGELLVNIDPTMQCAGLCDLHRLRFLDGGAFDGGTQLIIWSPRVGTPSPNANAITSTQVISASAFHKESGEMFDSRDLDLLPVQLLDVRDLLLGQPFGWLDIATEDKVYVGVRYSASNRFSIAIQSWCIPDTSCPTCGGGGGGDGAAIDIEKSTNGLDADTPGSGPVLNPADAVTWEYVVTNTGDVALSDVQVNDDMEGAVTCPKSGLAVGEQMTCVKSGIVPGDPNKSNPALNYANVATVTGTPPSGPDVHDTDPSHYRTNGKQLPVLIDIQKYTNGEDADEAPGPEVEVGSTVTWSYVVTNPNTVDNITVENIAVMDDLEGAVTCPKSTLAPGEQMTCTPKTGTAIEGQYANVATVTGQSVGTAVSVSDTDPSHYHGRIIEPPSIDIEKATNGHDADSAPGPQLTVGDPVTWTYVVTNTSSVALTNVAVVDDQEGAVSCPKTALAVGESMTCSASGTAILGQYANLATVTGEGPQGGQAMDTDPSHYFGTELPKPMVGIEKATNGHDADSAPGPTLTVGDPVTWTYVVTNTGPVTLSNVAVVDDQEGAVTCPKTTLAPGESMTCMLSGTVVEGQYANLAVVTGQGPQGDPATDSDPSHYYAETPPIGGQGCTPGYWKNHTDSWPPTGYSPAQSVQSVFSEAAAYPSEGAASLVQALDFNGGSGVEGGVRNLLRAAVAALLDASHPGVDYPETAATVISDVDAALASGDRDTMLSLASHLDGQNNLGCPLN